MRLYRLFVLLTTTATTIVLLLLAAASPLAMAVTFQGQDYPYEEPETNAARSPCPALNTLANHGLIPRNGKNINVNDLAAVASSIYSLSEQSVELMVNAHIQRGMAHRQVPNADGSTMILFDLSDTQALDHDASFTWLDEEFRNGVDDVNTCLVDSLMLVGYNFINQDDDNNLESNTSIILTPTSVERFLRMRYQDSKRYNPNFEWDDATLEILATQASQLFAVSDHPDLEAIDRSVLYEWLQYNRLSDNYVPRSTVYSFLGRPAEVGANIMRNDVSALLYDQFEAFLRTVVQEEITNAPAATPEQPMCVEDFPTSAPVVGGDMPTPASAPQATLPVPTNASMKPTMPLAAVSCSADGTDASKEPITTVRIATWAQVAPSLQAYVDAYHASISSSSASSSSSSSTSPRVQLQVFPSIRDLRAELLVDLQFRSQLYDGFVVPPFFMGDLFAEQGLLKLDDFVLGLNTEDNDDAAAAATSVHDGEQISSSTAVVEAWKDILPAYRNTLATFGGQVVELSKEENKEKDPNEDSDIGPLVNRVRMIPLLGGNQLTMWYRKDWLERYDLQPPRTWADYVRVAGVLHNETLGPNSESIVGSCLGRQSLETCRRAMNVGADSSGTTAGWCRSLSMSYLGMMMASMTQINNSSTGWAFYEQTQKDVGGDAATFRHASTTLKPLLQTVLETTLYLMEQQLRYGDSQEMARDTSLNVEMFRNGTCALTISAQPPQGLVSSLNQGKVGVAPLPGTYQVLKDRSLVASSRGDAVASFEDCTTQTCPYGVKDEEYGIINRVPFGGITDAAMGGISSQVRPHSQHAVKDFFQFVLTHPSILVGVQQEEYQPLRFSQLADFSVSSAKDTTSDALDDTRNDEILMSEYSALILSLTKGEASENAAIPLRTPKAFEMWSELDNRVHEYLSSNNFTEANRRQVRIDVEKHWNTIVDIHDSFPGAVPISTFYEKSLGTYKLTKPKDAYIGETLRYIGWACGAVCLLSSMGSALWVKYHIKERVVIASQPMFLWTICAGTFIMGLSIFPFGIEDDITSWGFASASCMGAVWFYGIGFCFLFAALYSKMGRINTVSADTLTTRGNATNTVLRCGHFVSLSF
jgi:hypothetical protein